MNTLETLKAMDALLCSPDRWAQGEYARDDNGRAVDVVFGTPNSGPPACFCLLGAAGKVTGAYTSEATRLLEEMTGVGKYNLSRWNDARNRTFAEVKDLLARAIAAEEAKA